MDSTKHILIMLVFTLLCSPFVSAQISQSAQASREMVSRDSREVTIIIQQERLRFAAQATAQEIRLEVFNQSGEIIYDSGLVNGPELSWALRSASGEAIPGGLYAYTLTVKDANSETPALRRGHLILENGRDRLWVTNQGAIGADAAMSGGELTVSSGPETSVAGARIGRASSARPTLNLDFFGTPGRIPKFTGSDFLDDSVISQDFNGRIGIGTQRPGTALLTVAGQIETTSGGIKFPNGSVQTASAAGALFQVNRNSTLTGNGTEDSPLGVNISSLGLLSFVNRNGTLTGFGTISSPLGVAVPLTLNSSQGNALIGYSSAAGFAAVYGENIGGSTGYGVYGRGTSGFAMYSEGAAGQSRDKGGWVKAMLFVNPNGTIVRCFNGLTGASTGNCGFSVSHPATGIYDFNFGFQVDDRFITTSSVNNFGSGGCFGGVVTMDPPAGNAVRVRTFCGSLTDVPYTIIVF